MALMCPRCGSRTFTVKDEDGDLETFCWSCGWRKPMDISPEVLARLDEMMTSQKRMRSARRQNAGKALPGLAS